MSTTGLAPTLNLDGPLPVAPEYTLLSLPGVLKEELAEGEDARWTSGVNVWGYPEDVPQLWEPCSTGTFRTKSEGVGGDLPRFDPIGMYVPITCSAISVGDPDFFSSRAEAVLRAAISHGVEQALAQGVALSTNPFLGDTNLVALLPAPVAVDVGLACLANAIGQTGRQGIIHATPAAVDKIGFNNLKIENEGSENEYITTASGIPVVAGGGYIGTDPASEPAPAAPPAGTVDWIFATGPVEARIATMPMTEIYESLDRSDNTVVYRAERLILVEWDTTLQVGVRVDWSL